MGIKENVVVHIKGCPTLLDLIIVDMPEGPIAPIILGRPFLRTVKSLINLHEGNVRFELPLENLLFSTSPGKRKARRMTMGSSH